MRVLVTGSRTWEDEDAILLELAKLAQEHGSENITVVHGQCPSGADEMADRIAIAWSGMTVERHPADWQTYGKRAGFVRNAEMVASGADVCLAFIRNGSRGASMCATLALKAKIPTKFVTHVD